MKEKEYSRTINFTFRGERKSIECIGGVAKIAFLKDNERPTTMVVALSFEEEAYFGLIIDKDVMLQLASSYIRFLDEKADFVEHHVGEHATSVLGPSQRH